MSDEKWHIVAILPEDMQRLLKASMKEGGVTWSDLEAIDNPAFYNDPYQLRWTFKHGPGGDQKYRDWAPGDVVTSQDDPKHTEYVIVQVERDDNGLPTQCVLRGPDGTEGLEECATLWRLRKKQR